MIFPIGYHEQASLKIYISPSKDIILVALKMVKKNRSKMAWKLDQMLPIDSHILYDLSVLILVSWPIWLTSAKYEAWVFERRIPASDS